MSSITSIRNAIGEIKKITDQPHYEKLNNELKILIERSSAFDEYINLLELSKLYISNVKDVVNLLYILTGNEFVFKTIIDSLSNNKTFNYDVIPLNSNKITKVSTYTYFDTLSFDLILSVLRAVSLARPTDIDNTQFFLPQSTASVNEIAQNITTDYVSNILVERVNIDKYLKSIKTNASKLKVTPTQSTTPTSVATSSSKDVDDYIKEFEKNDAYFIFDDVNNEFKENYNKFINSKTLQENLKDKPFLTKQIKVYEDHINLVKKYTDDILNFNRTPKYNQEKINETLVGLDKDIQILTKLLNIAKDTTKDSKPTPPASPTPSPTTPTTPTKPNEKKPEVPLTPEQWGIKFTVAESFATKLGKKDPFSPLFGPNSEVVQNSFYMDLLPARQSTIPVQGGRDVPNAMPGLNYKLVTQVGKQPIPGFSPVYQNLGVKGMQVTIVGAFTGADGDNTRGTDTPIPKDSKDKTPTWINPKGSSSTSDNPGRGGKLPELSAYNSYTEFVQLCQQGKHMEVEINLFQVYKENIASKIGQDIKLQSTSGNPKFNGIVRSLDVYHATKERTWYTLIMDVTDFGMASKDPIDLNNELDEAVKAAQAELDRINQLKKQQETTEAEKNATDIVEESSQNPANETANNALLKELSNIKDKVEATNDEGQINSYNHMMRVLNYIQNSRFYVFGEYLKGSTPFPFTDYFIKSIANSGKYDDIQFTTKGNYLIVSARVDCTTVVATEVTSTCSYHFYWKIDKKSSNKVITRYWKNRENIATLNLDRRLFESLKGLSLNPNYLNRKRYNDSSDMSEEEFNNLTSGIVGWNGNVAKLIASEFFGCAGGSLTFAGVGLVGGPPAALSIFTIGLLECGVSALGNSIQATQEFNKNAQREDYVQIAISSAIMGFFTNLGFAVFRGVGSKVTGGSFRQGAFDLPKKQGGNVKGGINQISSFIPTLVNKAKANIGKTIKYGNQTAIIDAVDGIPTINGKVAVRLKVGAETRTVPIEDIANELDNIVPSTVTTTTAPDSANSSTATSSQTAGNTVSRLDKAIDDTIKGLAPNIKQVIKSKPNKQTILGLMKRYENNITNPQGQRKIKVDFKGGSVIVNEIDTINFSPTGVRIQNNLIPYEDITNVSTLPKTTVTKPPVTPQPIAPTSLTDNLINALDNSIISSQAKTNLINNADDSFKRTVIELLEAKQNGILNQYELYYAGNGTSLPLINITVSENKIYLYHSNNGVDGYSFTQNLSGRIRKVQSTPTPSTPPQQNIPDNQSSSPTQQSSSGGGGSQGSTVPTPVGLTGKALEGFKKLEPFINKQLAFGKKIIITFNNGRKFIADELLTVRTEDELGNLIINKKVTLGIRIFYVAFTGLIVYYFRDFIPQSNKIEDIKEVKQE